MGGTAGDGFNHALDPRCVRRRIAFPVRETQQGGSHCLVAMVDRAPQRCIREKSPTHEGARHGLDRAGRDVFRRRTVRSTERRRGGTSRATGEYGKADRCPCRRGNGCPSRGFVQSFYRAAVVPGWQDRRRRRYSRSRRNSKSGRCPALLYDRQRVVFL